MSRISRFNGAILLASTCLAAAAQAQTAEPAAAQPVEPAQVQTGEDAAAAAAASAGEGDIIVTGTREAGVQAADSAAPIQVLGEQALSRVGQPNLNQALTQIVPSFTAQTQGTDLSNFSLSARLRGVSPNHTLLLVNGKRRHGSSILQVIAGAFQGSAAPSIDLIPPDAVQRIEIFQEGAAAQYGSDAIAGVINIILKNEPEGGSVRATAGQYFDGEGTLYSVSGNLGYRLGEQGFLNLTLFHRRNGYTFIGDGQTTVRNLDGTPVTAGISPAFQPIYAALDTANINGGQAKSALSIAFFNAGYDFDGVELYGFGDIARRVGSAKQGYRVPNRICANAAVPATCFADTGVTGMVPLQEGRQDEFSLSAGFRGDSGGWKWDVGGTYAEETFDISTTESANRSLFIDTFLAAAATPTTADSGFTPTDFYDGGFRLTQFTGTVDVNREFDVGLADPLTFAFGAEYRRETYAVVAGDVGSRYKEGGQSFPGYSLSDAGSTSRNAKGVYANVIVKPVTEWTIDLAGRLEDYSDFGDAEIGKITTRFDFSEGFAIRGTASTGFRAPSLAEGAYSATNVTPTSASVQLPPNSPAAALLGFRPLSPEKATNFSAGLVLRPIPRLTVTLDGYYIKIKDRIAGTAAIRGLVNNVPQLTPLINGLTPFAAVNAAIAARGTVIDAVPTVSVQTFTNGIDTRTVGVEFSSRYPVDLAFGRLDLSLGANYNDTKVVENNLGPALFSPQAEGFLETANPRFKAVAGVLLTAGRFSVNVRETYYSKSTVLVFPAISGQGPFDAVVKATPITDLEVDYALTDWLKFSIGANNLFDKKPEIPGLLSVPVASGISPYINGTTTINAPFTHGPYGTNGGYYYARLSFDF